MHGKNVRLSGGDYMSTSTSRAKWTWNSTFKDIFLYLVSAPMAKTRRHGCLGHSQSPIIEPVIFPMRSFFCALNESMACVPSSISYRLWAFVNTPRLVKCSSRRKSYKWHSPECQQWRIGKRADYFLVILKSMWFLILRGETESFSSPPPLYCNTKETQQNQWNFIFMNKNGTHVTNSIFCVTTTCMTDSLQATRVKFKYR